jgi:hypothetical protein
MEFFILKHINKYLFVLRCIIPFFDGCETDLGSENLPYIEKIVVRGVLQEGHTLDSIFVGKTLSYRKNYNYSSFTSTDGILTDAAVTVTCNNVAYPLLYSPTGFYSSSAAPIIISGNTYTLHVEWNGKIAEAVTTIPYSPSVGAVTVTQKDISTSYQNQVEYTYSGTVHSQKNNAIYTTAYSVDTSTNSYYGYGQSGVFLCSSDSIVGTAFSQQLTVWDYSGRTNKLFITVQAYDSPFYAYYLTFSEYSSDDYFSNPSPTAWNVTGDGIGMFIGTSAVVVKNASVE